MQNYLKHFLELTKIPRCSHHTEAAKEYIVSLAKRYGYDVAVDNGGNILATAQGASITLQSHYDMVCMGKAPKIEVVIQDDCISGKDSSLGSDNGMGCAMMLALMQEGVQVDCLFTNDEEVGLLGANALDLDIKTQKMLNLDSEEYGKIYLGCAGGVDLKFFKEDCFQTTSYTHCYEVSFYSDGGHSGVDIDKGIDNPIIEIAKYLNTQDCELISFHGGERINAIPNFSKAVVAANVLQGSEKIDAIKINQKPKTVLSNSSELLQKIASYHNGVLSYDAKLETVLDSCNFAIINNNSFEISLRSMNRDNLEKITQDTIDHFQLYSYEKNGKYEPWEPQMTLFAKEVKEKYHNASFAAIHAGLECAIISKKYPQLEIVSIGPDIYFPHSVKEKCNLKSCEKIFKLIKTLL